MGTKFLTFCFLLLLAAPTCVQGDEISDLKDAIAQLNSTLNANIAQLQSTIDTMSTAVTAADEHAANVGIALNILWIIIGGTYVFFMQAGFAMVEAGLAQSKNAANVTAQNFAIFALGFVAFWFFGYAWAFGGFTYSAFGFNEAPGKNGIGKDRAVFLWTGGYAMSKTVYTDSGSAFFFYMVAFMDTTATIPTGSMAERWTWWSFVVWGIYAGAWYYPLFAAWTWGGGWLSQLGNSGNIGFGFVDFAGSGVVHMTGGVAAIWGAYVLGPRRGRYNEMGEVNAFPPHNVPMVALGCFILLFGWFGFNAASTFAATDTRFAVAATNTVISAAFAGFTAVFWIPLRSRGKRTTDICAVMNAALNGLVSITGPCAFVAPWASAVIGVIGAILCLEAAPLIDRKLDDPAGAVSVHFVGGLWGVLSLGLFADGTYGEGWNGTTTALTAGRKVTGLFYSGNLGGRQFAAQFITALVLIPWMSLWAFGFFKLSDIVFRKLGSPHGIRSDPELDEIGLDTSEMGCNAYVNEPPRMAPADVEHTVREVVAELAHPGFVSRREECAPTPNFEPYS